MRLQQRQRAAAARCSSGSGARLARLVPRAAVAGGKVYIDPVKQECAAFAPATVANLGPGFDWLGCAVEVGGGLHGSRQRPGSSGIGR